jgi:arabinose-5-phosphate isomerase
MNWDSKIVLEKGRQCIRVEAEALEATAENLDPSFAEVIQQIEATVSSGRKIIFSGVGKSAHIGQKLAGTFNSVGAPACFLDPTQALHGDLGLCAEGDLALLISNSGTTEELVRLVPLLKRFGLITAVITGQPGSRLSIACDKTLLFHVAREACPLQLAPTASTTAAMALGDALAMVYVEKRGFTREDFARFHPSGALGMRLLLRIDDIMRRGDRFPCLSEIRPVKEAILAMTKARAGCIALVENDSTRLSGIFTDGDFRRSALSGTDFLDRPLADFMTRNPKTISVDSFAVDALKLFEQHNIEDLIVIDAEGSPVGLVDTQDLPKLKLV